MKIKKYIANTLQEGKSRIFRELGEDAVILSTRNINKPGESGSSLIEIVAAIDENIMQNNKTNQIQEQRYNPINNDELDPEMMIETTSKLFDEIYVMKSMLNDISEQIKYKNISNLASWQVEVFKILSEIGFSEDFALSLIYKASQNQANDKSTLITKIYNMLIGKIKMINPIEKKDTKQVIAFIGSTGSGKTSSLVKLAIISKLIMNCRILIVSSDTQKVNGPDQLQVYSSIAGIQFRTAHNNDDLREIIQKENDFDYIFIDTSGTSQFNALNIEELSYTLYKISPDYMFLVMPANITKSTIKSIFSGFKKFNPNALILTKIDETINFGELLEELINYNIPIAYLSNGQNIPDDIEPIDKQKILDLMLPNFNSESQK